MMINFLNNIMMEILHKEVVVISACQIRLEMEECPQKIGDRDGVVLWGMTPCKNRCADSLVRSA